MTDTNTDTASEQVHVTLRRADWDRIMRLVASTVPAAEQSVEDAYDLGDGEKPDDAWIEGREDALREARAFRDRVAAAGPLSQADDTIGR